MKALTLRQPFASLVMAGLKDLEVRSQRSSYRGELAIHAAKAAYRHNDPVAIQAWQEFHLHGLTDIRGAIIGTVRMMDSRPFKPEDLRRAKLSIWMPRRWAHVFAAPRQAGTLVGARGRLGFWELPSA